MSVDVQKVRFRAEDLGVLEQLAAQRAIEHCHLRPLGRRLIVVRYLDTPDWTLLSKGCSYREREFDRRRWVSFRGSPDEMGHPPRPLEAELPEGVTLEEINDLFTPTLRAWGAVGFRSMHEILRVENNRALIELVEQGQPRFLMCLDDVEFFANGCQRRCCEVKIDTRRDPNHTLDWLCYTLSSQFGLVPLVGGKLERGLAVTGARPAQARQDGAEPKPAGWHSLSAS